MFSVLPKNLSVLDYNVNAEAGLGLVTTFRTKCLDLNYFGWKDPKAT